MSTITELNLEIPGAGYACGRPIAAEADGELETIRTHGLPPGRVMVEADPAEGVRSLRSLTARITRILQEG